MAKLSICLIIILIVLFCIFATYYTCKAYIKAKKKISQLEAQLDNQKKNLIYIVRHSQELADIATSRAKIDKEISEAKTDEEVVDIINTIIDCNNNRVRVDKTE